MKKYNVILLMTDQHRWDCLGCYGNPVIQTPNLDRLAKEGTIFTNGYTAVPSCIPARACLLTGMNQWNTGILGMGRGQKKMGTGFDHTLPGELTAAGYQTQGVGKMHFFPQRALNGFENIFLDESGRQEDPGFISDYQQWFEANRTSNYNFIADDMDWNGWQAHPYHAPDHLHPTSWTGMRSLQFLQDQDTSRPFFLKVSFSRPHSPYDAIERWFSYYDKLELPKAIIGEWATMHDDPTEAERKAAWRGKKSEEIIHKARAGYYGNVSYIDEQIGKIFEELERQGVYEESLIIFTSDHGDMLGDHNLWRKTYAYESSAHIPFIVKLPKSLQRNIIKSEEKVIELRDIMPTVLDILGLPIPNTVDGMSVYPLIKGESPTWREYLHGEHCWCYHEEQEMQYLTDGKMKYIWLPRLNREQLFDLEKDRQELLDLAQKPECQEEVKRWRSRLIFELEARGFNVGKNSQLISQKGKKPFVSPKYYERVRKTKKKWYWRIFGR
jgi:choline-sulfatase